jgi:hypothetical protein
VPNVPSHNAEMVAVAILLALGFVQAAERAPAEKPVRPEFFIPPSHRPILSEISVQSAVFRTANSPAGVVKLPAPSAYSGQAVVGLKVTCDPPSALKTWKLETDPNGLMSVLVVSLMPGTGKVVVRYEAQVLTPNEGVVRMQSRDFQSWTKPTATVQSIDPEIVELAKTLQAGTTSRTEFVGRVVKWVAANKLREVGNPDVHDAKSALAFGGDSLGRANLCAAILRAGSVAVRVVTAIPVWADRIPAEFWLDEVWSEDGTWQLIDPTVGIQYVSRDSEVVIAIARPSDESDPSGLNFTKFEASIRVIRPFPPQSGARLLMAAVRRSAKVSHEGEAGHATWIDDLTLQRVIKKGPVNLALFLDGHPTM